MDIETVCYSSFFEAAEPLPLPSNAHFYIRTGLYIIGILSSTQFSSSMRIQKTIDVPYLKNYNLQFINFV